MNINSANTTEQMLAQTRIERPGEARPSSPPVNSPNEPVLMEYNVNELQEMAKAANAIESNSRIRFEIKEDSPPIMVIVDPETNEVIKQIPPEEIQKVRELIRSALAGEDYITNFIDRYV